ncbi:unnamed protein product [Blepharisma stoltei]|uniref:Uncharacterized protein n=1 Tax=Blepharisma stoltei TaxID=1481888 RepID=A0AAU9J7V9_9CILI|nr:unnamed protein product [Blepharisma stoltei]
MAGIQDPFALRFENEEDSDPQEKPIQKKAQESGKRKNITPEPRQKNEPTDDSQSSSKSKTYAKWGLLFAKSEIALYDLKQVLYRQTLIELGLMILALLILIVHVKFMIIIHILHLVRPYFAYKLLIAMPRSHQFYEKLPDDLSKITNDLQGKAYDEIRESSRQIAIYLAISAAAGVLDIIALLINFEKFYSHDTLAVVYFVLSFLFICTDFFLPLWYWTLQFTFPSDVWLDLLLFAKGSLNESKLLVMGILRRTT